MMEFDHRKFLIPEGDKNPKLSKKFETDTDCYMCYVCPEDCYVSPLPPPPPPQLSPPPPPQFSSKNHIPTVLILMLRVLGVAFLVLSYLTLARYRRRNSRSRNSEPLETSRTNFLDENHGPVLDHPIWYIRTVGLPQSVIDSIASFTYTNGLIDGNDCSVCLNEFQENEMLRLLPKCSHAFHLDCIDIWLRSHKNCPVCRAPVVSIDASHTRATSVESSPSSSSGGGGSSSSGSNEVTTPMPIQLIQGGDHVNINIDILAKNGGVMEKHRVVSDLQGVRRSVSMDFSMMKNSTSSLQKGGISMKRSFSFSGKRSLRKNSRS